MKLIVTRPAAQAAAWVQQLQRLGWPAAALPLIDIAPPDDTAPVRAAWIGLPRMDLVMFVSANAVQHFFAAAPQAPPAAIWPPAVRAGSTGPGTRAALQAAGVPLAAIVSPPEADGRFDSEALWACLSHEAWAGRHVLVVRGEAGRDWLADALRDQGAELSFVAAYRRLAPRPDAAGQALLQAAQADPAGHAWLFSSSEAVEHLRALAPGADWSRSVAVASHPRIAQAACEAGFGRVLQAPPLPAAVVAVVAEVRAGMRFDGRVDGRADVNTAVTPEAKTAVEPEVHPQVHPQVNPQDGATQPHGTPPIQSAAP